MYSIYNLITGQIKRHDSLPNVNVGECAVEGRFDLSTYYVQGGRAIKIPPQMDPGTVFDYLLGRWVITPWQDIRELIGIRNHKLARSDWTDTVSFRKRMGDEVADAWDKYRQELRDITKHPGFPMDFAWPEPPK
jgi:hypothetical protein